MIRSANVQRAYKTAAGVNYVVRSINLETGEGEFITVMGSSASRH